MLYKIQKQLSNLLSKENNNNNNNTSKFSRPGVTTKLSLTTNKKNIKQSEKSNDNYDTSEDRSFEINDLLIYAGTTPRYSTSSNKQNIETSIVSKIESLYNNQKSFKKIYIHDEPNQNEFITGESLICDNNYYKIIKKELLGLTKKQLQFNDHLDDKIIKSQLICEKVIFYPIQKIMEDIYNYNDITDCIIQLIIKEDTLIFINNSDNITVYEPHFIVLHKITNENVNNFVANLLYDKDIKYS